MGKVKQKKKMEKRACCMLLCLSMLGGAFIPGTSVAYAAEAAAQQQTVQKEEKLQSRELSVQEYLMQCWKAKKEEIDMRPYHITWDEMNSIFFQLHYENPELYFILQNASYIDNKETGLVETYFQGYPLDRSGELEAEWKIVEEKTKDCRTDLEKAMVVHDYLCDTILYSFSLGVTAHDIEGAILEKKAVCEGYALAYKYYMNRLGIPCKVIGGMGDGGPHAWNQIEINGKWYLVDATWDDPADGNGVGHQYFLCSEDKFNQHTWVKENYEICDDTTYDEMFWHSNWQSICGYQGNLYYSGYKITSSGIETGIFRYDAEKTEQEGTLVLPIDEMWKIDETGQKRYCSEIVYDNGNLYYNTPKAIWKWDFNTQTKPEKVLELDENIQGEIWTLEISGGTLYYETSDGEKAPRTRHRFVLDPEYAKKEQPISVTSDVMTVALGGKDVFLKGAAPGALTYTSQDPTVCAANVVYRDRSCQLAAQKAGTTQIIVRAEESDRYLGAEKIVTVNVVKSDTQLEVYLDDETVDSSHQKFRLSGNVTLSLPERNQYLPTGTIALNVLDENGENLLKEDYITELDETKTVSFNLEVPGGAGTYRLIARYSGDGVFNKSNASVSCRVTGSGTEPETKVPLHYEAGENGNLQAAVSLTGEKLENGALISPQTKVTFTAEPEKGYLVKNWLVNGEVYQKNGEIYRGRVLEQEISSSADRIRVEFIKEEAPHIHRYELEKVAEEYKKSDATCTEPASYYKSCICGAHGEETFETGKPLGHDYGQPSWNWAEDGKSAEAVFVCRNDEKHIEKVKADITSEVTKEPAVGEMGETTYTATVVFEGNGVYADTKTVKDLPMLPEPEKNPFRDVTENDYFFYPVVWAAENKIAEGYGNTGKFEPHMICSRANVVTFLWRQAGSPKAPVDSEIFFTDVTKEDYFYDAVVWAVTEGITTGYGNTKTFCPNEPCTRANVVTFLWRANESPKAAEGTAASFDDVDKNDYFYDAVMWAVSEGVTEGYGNSNRFMPDEECTRAQTVTFLYRAAGKPLKK